jgi:hypothetical protein
MRIRCSTASSSFRQPISIARYAPQDTSTKAVSVLGVNQEPREQLKRIWPVLMMGALFGWSVFLYARYTQTIASGWDPLAYKCAGEQLAAGQGFAYCHPYNAQIGPYFTMAGFNVRADDNACLYLNYPIGFPFLLAAAQRLFSSPGAAWYVPAISAMVGLLAAFGMGAALFDQWVGLLAAVILALAPTYLTFGTSLWSDLPGVAALNSGLALYLLRTRWTTSTWLKCTQAVVAGTLVTLGLFTRYANGIMLLPWMAYVLFSQRRAAFKDTSNWVFGAVVLVGLAGVLLFNHRYYGTYLGTSYSPEHGWYAWPAFSLRYVLGNSPVGEQSLLATVRTIWSNFAWLLLLAGWGVARMRTPQRILLLGSVLVFAGIYAGYAFPPQGINARFLLPTFPFIGLAAGYGLWSAAPERWRWWWRVLGIVMMALVLLMPLPDRLQGLAERNASHASFVDGIERLVEGSESDAVFLTYNTNDAIAYYGQRATLFYRRIPPPDSETGGYRLEVFEERLVAAVDTLLENGVPVYYVQDSDPPFWESLAIVKRHFGLHPLGTTPPVYRVQRLSGDG